MYIEENAGWLPLDLLQAGEEARIMEVTGSPTRVHQLAEIGLRSGCVIRMVRSGQPSFLIVDGRRLSIRLGNDAGILVQLIASSRAG